MAKISPAREPNNNLHKIFTSYGVYKNPAPLLFLHTSVKHKFKFIDKLTPAWCFFNPAPVLHVLSKSGHLSHSVCSVVSSVHLLDGCDNDWVLIKFRLKYHKLLGHTGMQLGK